MILLDVNILVNAINSEGSDSDLIKSWLDARLRGIERVGMPWHTILGFARIVTHPRIFAHPVSIPKAWETIELWLSCPNVWIPMPTERHLEVLRTLLPSVTKSELVPDAHLAALAIEHGLSLATSDRGFSRFSGLRIVDPLAIAGS
ncbi:MAG: TA system VapC family ribonuclease toxin [Candidatus Dormibacteraceae bacterium]